MTLIALYPSKKALKEEIGNPLCHQETSLFGAEYQGDGWLTVCNRPHMTGLGREWFGRVLMHNHIIKEVE